MPASGGAPDERDDEPDQTGELHDEETEANVEPETRPRRYVDDGLRYPGAEVDHRETVEQGPGSSRDGGHEHDGC